MVLNLEELLKLTRVLFGMAVGIDTYGFQVRLFNGAVDRVLNAYNKFFLA